MRKVYYVCLMGLLSGCSSAGSKAEMVDMCGTNQCNGSDATDSTSDMTSDTASDLVSPDDSSSDMKVPGDNEEPDGTQGDTVVPADATDVANPDTDTTAPDADAACVPASCEALGYDCGTLDDGCGQTLVCGVCNPPATCGGGGVEHKCGEEACVPKGCDELGYQCGPASDGCGNPIECGDCTQPQVCGGAGVAHQCGEPSEFDLVTPTATWAYSDSGEDLGTAWYAPDYDDSNWATGAAELGYGENDETTVVSYGDDQQNKYPTTYFRTTFSVQDTASINMLSLRLLVDDGAVVYINGTEVVRYNMAEGEVAWSDYATDNVGGQQEGTWSTFDVSTLVLVQGSNVIAVEVHQASASSSDMSFNLELSTACVPTSCDAMGFNCGTLEDGCGTTLQCGECQAPETCGGAGQENVCGENTCDATTCDEAGYLCGTLDDGCGTTLQCGECQAPETCGGGGVPHVCGLFEGTVLVAQGSTWSYLDSGEDLGSAWYAAGFNDSNWPTGPAEFGYGEDDEATVVGYGSDANNKYPTTYFRIEFQVQNASAFTSLTLRMLVDDGAVVYLNGTEVARNNMPEGAVEFATYAASNVATQQEGVWSETLLSSGWITGTNVLAVEVHQANAMSTDLSFDLELLGQ